MRTLLGATRYKHIKPDGFTHYYLLVFKEKINLVVFKHFLSNHRERKLPK